jgi:hypothetical protein
MKTGNTQEKYNWCLAKFPQGSDFHEFPGRRRNLTQMDRQTFSTRPLQMLMPTEDLSSPFIKAVG